MHPRRMGSLFPTLNIDIEKTYIKKLTTPSCSKLNTWRPHFSSNCKIK